MQAFGLGFNAHMAAAHGVAADEAIVSGDGGLAGKAERRFQVLLERRWRRKIVCAFDDLHHTLFAFALFAARGGDAHADLLRAIEQQRARSSAGGLAIDLERYQAASDSNSAFNCSATS